MSGDAFRSLESAARNMGILFSDDATRQLEAYVDTLLLWRVRLSLTAAATAEEIVQRHIVDSLYTVPFVRPGWRIADIGSGAGFPGVPLAIACPATSVVLIEARRKRANFLRQVVRAARLENVTVYEGRAEMLGEEGRSFDFVTSRALGSIPTFLDLTAMLLCSGGIALAMKGPKGRDEAQLAHPCFGAPELVPYHLSDGIERILLMYLRQ